VIAVFGGDDSLNVLRTKVEQFFFFRFYSMMMASYAIRDPRNGSLVNGLIYGDENHIYRVCEHEKWAETRSS
jgi:hypothetical protein